MVQSKSVRGGIEISGGRWLPTLDATTTWNFRFLEPGTQLRRVAAGAEQLVHTLPPSALTRLRLFGELLTREIAPMFGVPTSQGLDQFDVLRSLEGPRGPGRDVVDRLHALRRAGNAAAHKDEGSRRLALDCLKSAHHLAKWYSEDVLRAPRVQASFEVPPDPREQAKALLERADAASQTAAEQAQYIEELQAALDKEAKRAAEAERSAKDVAEQVQGAREDADAAEQLALEAEERSLHLLRMGRRLNSVKSTLAALGLDSLESADLPDWVAGVAAGAEPPAHVDLPDEVIEDLRALGSDLAMEAPEAPSIELRSSGRLSARSAPFSVAVLLRSADGATQLRRQGSVWKDGNGNERLLPPDLAAALDELAEGPPPTHESATDEAHTKRLWWARLKRRLAPHGVAADGYLHGIDVLEVAKFKPRLVTREDGSLELLVTVADMDPETVTRALDRLPDAPNLKSARIAGRGADGRPVRTELMLSPAAAESLRTIRTLRRRTAELAPQLIDAPASLLDPDLFDLSEYGDRVVGFGRVVYRVQPAMTAGPGGSTRFTLRPPEGEPGGPQAEPKELSPAKAAELTLRLEAAAGTGHPYVEFEGDWVRVPPPTIMEQVLGTSPEPARQGSLVVADNLEAEQFAIADPGRGTTVEVSGPPGLAKGITLFEYQREGLSWLAGHALMGPGASDHGLLADDMGLGKTLQVLSLMSLLQIRNELKPALVVAPLSLLQNWVHEAQRFFPGRFSGWIQLGGPGGLSRPTADQLKPFDVVLTSYESLRSQQLELGRVRWKLMVLDESDRVRNPTTRTNHAVLAMSAERRLALTGTPIQNSLVDLWAQFDWLSPGLLGDLRSFRKDFVRSGSSSDDATRESRVAQLRTTLGGRVLRRLKDEVLADELPLKTIRRHYIPMDPPQSRLYEQVLQDLAGGRGKSLGVMHRLFQACSAPGMLAADSRLSEAHPKLRWLLTHLDEIAPRGEKVAVFAEWYSVQDQLATAITSRFGIPVERVNGKVSAGLRLSKIDAFNRQPGFGVIVLGPKATGVGLNITGANHVVHFTRHWNPALEAQATDRVYRIGQTLPVTAHLPIVIHPSLTSIEEHLDRLLARKTDLARDFLAGLEDLDVGKELNAALQAPAK